MEHREAPPRLDDAHHCATHYQSIEPPITTTKRSQTNTIRQMRSLIRSALSSAASSSSSLRAFRSAVRSTVRLMFPSNWTLSKLRLICVITVKRLRLIGGHHTREFLSSLSCGDKSRNE